MAEFENWEEIEKIAIFTKLGSPFFLLKEQKQFNNKFKFSTNPGTASL